MHTKAMKKTIILCVTMLISVSMFAQTAILSQIKDTADCRKWVESQLATMTLKQKIGQLFIHTVEPSLMQRNKTNIQKAIEEYGLGRPSEADQLGTTMEQSAFAYHVRWRMGLGDALGWHSQLSKEPDIGMH